MILRNQDTPKILRIKQIKAQTGLPNSTVYYHIQQGLFIRPIKLGERMSGWLESEVNAIMAARIAGKSETEIKARVNRLVLRVICLSAPLPIQ